MTKKQVCVAMGERNVRKLVQLSDSLGRVLTVDRNLGLLWEEPTKAGPSGMWVARSSRNSSSRVSVCSLREPSVCLDGSKAQLQAVSTLKSPAPLPMTIAMVPQSQSRGEANKAFQNVTTGALLPLKEGESVQPFAVRVIAVQTMGNQPEPEPYDGGVGAWILMLLMLILIVLAVCWAVGWIMPKSSDKPAAVQEMQPQPAQQQAVVDLWSDSAWM